MKIRYVFIIGILLSLVTMTVLANRSEHGDINAMSMYFVVFLMPVLLMVVLNTVFIWGISTLKNPTIKLILSFLPLCIFILICLKGNLTIPSIDGNLVFVALTEAIAIGITNLLWIASDYIRRISGNNDK